MRNHGEQTRWRDQNRALWDERVGIHAASASYCVTAQAVGRETTGTYTDADRNRPTVNNTANEWVHSLGDVLSALAAAGLRLEFPREHDRTVFRHFANFERGEDNWWRPPVGQPRVPLMCSLKASQDCIRVEAVRPADAAEAATTRRDDTAA